MALAANYKTVFAVMLLGYVLHFIPQKWEDYTESLVARSAFVVKLAMVVLVIWLVVQSKQAEAVMPIYLQF